MNVFEVKEGKTSGWIDLCRTPEGILVWIKTSPAFETFFQSLGDGTAYAPESYIVSETNKWLSVEQDQKLEIYSINPENTEALGLGQRYRLDLPGLPLEVDASLGLIPNLNISFLRLKGIGGDAGVKFLIRGAVMSKTGVVDARDRIVRAVKYIYNEYVRPINAQGIIYESVSKEG